MLRRPPRSTRTDTLFPYPTLFRSTRPSSTDTLTLSPSRRTENLVPSTVMRFGPAKITKGCAASCAISKNTSPLSSQTRRSVRSEERRVGKECVSSVDLGGRRIIKKKKETPTTQKHHTTMNKSRQCTTQRPTTKTQID